MSASTSSSAIPPGETSPSWRMHIAIAKIAYDKGLFSAAARNYLTAMSISASLKLRDEDLSVALIGLAKCQCELGNFGQAESLYKRVLDIDHATLSGSSATLAEDLNHLATLYLKTDRLTEAEALLKKSTDILNVVDVHSIHLATAEKNLSYIYCQTGRLKEAERSITQALSICDSNNGRQTKVFAEAIFVQGLIAAKRGCLSEAEDLIEQAIASLAMLTGGQHPELAEFLDLAANFFEREHAQDKASELKNRAQAIRAQIRAMDH